MHVALSVQISVGIFATHQKRRRFDSDFFALLNVDHLRTESAALDPALIHAQEHVRPVARFGAAGPGMDRHESIRAIVFAREKLPQLKRLELLNDASVFRGQFFLHSRARRQI